MSVAWGLHRVVICLCLVCSGFYTLSAQKTTRGKLKLRDQVVITPQPVALYDTLRNVADDIRLSGFEKTRLAVRETLFVTNNLDKDIHQINLTIDYFDVSGRQLHRRSVSVNADIPPGQTRQVSFVAWDRQGLWYYTNTQSRPSDYASPFDVNVSVDYVTVAKNLDNL